VQSDGRSSTGEFLSYFCCIFTFIGVVAFTVSSLQEKHKDEVIKWHGENFNWQDEAIDSEAIYASRTGEAHGWGDAVFCLTL
jgi:hypothetical protein